MLTYPLSIFKIIITGIIQNYTAAASIFSTALEWELFLPSLLDPIISGYRTLPKDLIAEFMHSVSSRFNSHAYEENTVGVAPVLALSYVRILELFYQIKSDVTAFTSGNNYTTTTTTTTTTATTMNTQRTSTGTSASLPFTALNTTTNSMTYFENMNMHLLFEVIQNNINVVQHITEDGMLAVLVAAFITVLIILTTRIYFFRR